MTSIFFNLIDSAKNPLVGSKVTIKPFTPPYISGSVISSAAPVSLYTDNTGAVTFTNVIAGTYKVSVSPAGAANTGSLRNTLQNFANEVFYISAAPNAGTINGTDCLITQPSNTGVVFTGSMSNSDFFALTISASDARYVLKGGSINNAISASYAQTSSWANNVVGGSGTSTSSSWASSSLSASWARTSITSSILQGAGATIDRFGNGKFSTVTAIVVYAGPSNDTSIGSDISTIGNIYLGPQGEYAINSDGTIQGFTSFDGTASWANTASYALNASGNSGPKTIIYASVIGCHLNAQLSQSWDDNILDYVYDVSGSDDTALLQSALNTNSNGTGSIELVMDGNAMVSGLQIYSNTTITCLEGCGFYLTSSAGWPILRNAHPNSSSIVDTNITLDGGYYYCNEYNQRKGDKSMGGLNNYILHSGNGDGILVGVGFYGIQNLIVKNITIDTGASFAFSFSNWQDVVCDNINIISVVQDALHFYTGDHATVTNIYGTSGNDFVAFNATDIITGDTLPSPWVKNIGPLTNVYVENIKTIGALDCVTVLCADQNVDGITIKHVRGTARIYGVSIWNFWALSGGTVKNILIEDVNITSVGIPQIRIYNSMNPGGSLHIDNIQIKNCSYDGMIAPQWLSISKGVTIDNLQIDGVTIYTRLVDVTGAYIVSNDGNINDLSLGNVSWFRPTGSTATGTVLFVSGSVGTASLYNIQTNNLASIVTGSGTIGLQQTMFPGQSLYASKFIGTASYAVSASWAPSITVTTVQSSSWASSSLSASYITSSNIRGNITAFSSSWASSSLSSSYFHNGDTTIDENGFTTTNTTTNFPNGTSIDTDGNVIVNGKITAASLDVEGTTTLDAGIITTDGAGNLTVNGNINVGTIYVTGASTLDNGLIVTNGNGQLVATGFTGSLFGTASWAQNIVGGSGTSVSSSWASSSLSASYITSSNIRGTVTSSSYALSASFAPGSSAATYTSSLFGTASWANNTLTSSYIITAQTASYVKNAISSSYPWTMTNLTASLNTPGNTGLVGIGLGNPVALLDVSATGPRDMIAFRNAGIGDWGIFLDGSNNFNLGVTIAAAGDTGSFFWKHKYSGGNANTFQVANTSTNAQCVLELLQRFAGNTGDFLYATTFGSGSGNILAVKNNGDLIVNSGRVAIGANQAQTHATLQVGFDDPSQTVGTNPLVRLIGNPLSSTPQTILRLNRAMNPGNIFGGNVDFNVYSYGSFGSPFFPKTQMDIKLKSTADQVETAAVNVMSLRDNGNVGIGTTTPANTLDVNGNMNASSISASLFRSNSTTTGSTAPVTLVGYYQINIAGTNRWTPYYSSP